MNPVKFNITFTMISGKEIVFTDVIFGNCSSVPEIRSWMNESYGLININNKMVNLHNVEFVDVEVVEPKT